MGGRIRRLGLGAALVLGAATATVIPMGAAPATAAAPVLPAPCGLAPAALVAPALGVAKSAVHPTFQATSSDGFTIHTCVFVHGSARLNVTVAPAAYGSGGGVGFPPGFVVQHPTGLGPHGELLHDTSPSLFFATANFVKGALWGHVYSTAHVPLSAVLALGRYVYAHLK